VHTIGFKPGNPVVSGGEPNTNRDLPTLLRIVQSQIQIWDQGNENERDVTVYDFNPDNPALKDELLQAVKDTAGFIQTRSWEFTRDWELERGVLQWCVPSDTERWDSELHFSTQGETTVHTIGFAPPYTGDTTVSGWSAPAIAEPVTGRASITYTGIALTGDGASITVPRVTNADAGTELSITGGKLTLTLTTPAAPLAISTLPIKKDANDAYNGWGIFGNTNGDNALTFDPANGGVTAASIGSFSVDNSGYGGYKIARGAYDTDEAGYENGTEICYIYVSGDVTITRAAKTIGRNYYHAINLPLKAGWNLVQVDQKRPKSGGSVFSVKIAGKDIPWRYYKSG
jgi:hypothetical protein